VDDSLRRFCVFEPRGRAQKSTNLLFPPTRPDADAGVIVLQGDKAHAMSGSNCICVVTVLLETGMLPMREPQTVVRLDTPAGLVAATAHCKDGKCECVSLDMVPSFVEALDRTLAVPDPGEVRVDFAFGGVYYALIDPRPLGLSIEPAAARARVNAASRIHRALNAEVEVRHPERPPIHGIAYAMFVDTTPEGALIGATILPPGADRPLALRHRQQRPPGGPPRPRRHAGRRHDDGLVDHRQPLRGRTSWRDHDRRPAGGSAANFRARLDSRAPPDRPRSRRPLPAGLPARELLGRRLRSAQVTRRRGWPAERQAVKPG
jgi:hypothetical protein